MMQYRKRPVVIEAMQFKSTADYGPIYDWAGGAAIQAAHRPSSGRPTLIIATLEGDMMADIGDWIIRGVKGEFYPCKPDIFEATYEAVS